MSHFFIKNGNVFKEVPEDIFINFYHKFDNDIQSCEFEQWAMCWLRLNFLVKITDSFVRVAYIEFDA